MNITTDKPVTIYHRIDQLQYPLWAIVVELLWLIWKLA